MKQAFFLSMIMFFLSMELGHTDIYADAEPTETASEIVSLARL